MTIGKRATDSVQSDYRELPDGFIGRFIIGEPKLRKIDGKYGPYWMVDFPLTLTEPEKDRVRELLGEPPKGQYQSYRPAFGGYSCGYKFGKFEKSGVYKSEPMIDFISAALGVKNQREFRAYIEAGGGPAERDDATEAENIAICESWLGWLEGLEIYGTIKHEEGNRGLLARFGGPIPVGSLPGQPEPDYQTIGKGKLRAMMAENQATGHVEKAVAAGAEIAARYDETGAEVSAESETDDEEAELERRLAKKRAAKAAGQQQTVSAGAVTDDAYNKLFGESA